MATLLARWPNPRDLKSLRALTPASLLKRENGVPSELGTDGPQCRKRGPRVLYNQKAPNLEFQVASGPAMGSDEECVFGDPNPCSRT